MRRAAACSSASSSIDEQPLDGDRVGERALDHRQLVGRLRIVDQHLEHEAVDLGLGQRIRALGLDRVLRRHHEKRRRHGVGLLADRHLPLLHHLEEGGLHLGRSPIDLVGEQEVAEHRPELGVELVLAGAVHPRADEVGRHEIRRELHPLEPPAEHFGDGLDGQCLRQAGDALDQEMPTCQETDEHPFEHLVLPCDDALDLEDGALDRIAVGAGFDGFQRLGSAILQLLGLDGATADQGCGAV